MKTKERETLRTWTTSNYYRDQDGYWKRAKKAVQIPFDGPIPSTNEEMAQMLRDGELQDENGATLECDSALVDVQAVTGGPHDVYVALMDGGGRHIGYLIMDAQEVSQ